MKNTIISLLLLVITALAFGTIIDRKSKPVVKLVPVIDPNYVQNPYEAQERLKAQGYYHGKIDAIWGPKSDKAYCNWCGVQAIRRTEK